MDIDVDVEEETRQEKESVATILSTAEKNSDNLIGILLEVQKELGYLPSHAMTSVADFLDMSETDVWSVATFYNEFRFIPKGKHHVRVCLGTACYIKGGPVIMQEWERRLGIEEGGLTENRMFSLERVGCVGCCSLAPVIVMDEKVHGKVSPTSVEGLVMKTEMAEKEPGKDDGGDS